MNAYIVVARPRSVLVSGAIVALMVAISLYLVLSHGHTRAQLFLALISAGLFSLWLLRMVHVYGLRLDVDADSVMLKRFGRRSALRKNAIRLTKATFNGRMRVFHFK